MKPILSHRVKLIVAYDGTDFCGWQKQLVAQKPSIQESLEGALTKIFKEPINCVASGRTDSGVHAHAQVVHFDAPRGLGNINLVKAVRGLLPETIVVKSAEEAKSQFHALFSAKAKTYRYVISTKKVGPAFLRRFCHWYPYRFNLEALQGFSSILEGTHDFKSFQSVGTPILNTTRTIYKAQWLQKRPDIFYFEVTGSGFLKQMVRNLVGTQLYFMQKGYSSEDFKKVLLAKDRTIAAYAAPPQGLFLVKVYYPKDLDNNYRGI